MTEARAFILIGISGVLLTTVAVLSMLALGVRGVGLSLGVIVPLAIGADCIGRVVVHYGENGRRKR